MEWIKENIIVKFRADITDAEWQAKIAHYGTTPIRRNKALRIELHKVDPTRRDAVLAEMQTDPDIVYAHEDLPVKPAAVVPNDPYYGTDSPFDGSVQLKICKIIDAWEFSRGNAGQTIQHIDTGIQADHPDLVGRIVEGWSYTNNSTNTNDQAGHGTMTGGLIVANPDNGIGIPGVNWYAKLKPYQISDDGTIATLDACTFLFSSSIADATDSAVASGDKIISMSWLSPYDMPAVQDAAEYADANGVLLVAAAGNYGSDKVGNPICYPAAYPTVLAVGASRMYDTPAYSSVSNDFFSEYGPWVDVVAPGQWIPTTNIGSDYIYTNGTSFSCPITAGILSLALDVNPDLTHHQLAAIAKYATRSLSGKPQDPMFCGYGRVDALKVVQTAKLSYQKVLIAAYPKPGSIHFANGSGAFSALLFEGIVFGGLTVTAIHLYVDGESVGSATASPYQISWTPPGVATYAWKLVAKNGSTVVAETDVFSLRAVLQQDAPVVEFVYPAAGATVPPNVPVLVRTATSSGNGIITSITCDEYPGINPYTTSQTTDDGPKNGNEALDAVIENTLGHNIAPALADVGFLPYLPPGNYSYSGTYTLSDINIPVSVIPLNGSEYSVNSGAWASAPGSVSPGNTLRMRAPSPQLDEPDRVCELKIGKSTLKMLLYSTASSKPVVTITQYAPGKVRLTWTSIVWADNYKVKYGTTADYGTTVTAGNVNVAYITGLTNGVQYHFTVIATNGANEGPVEDYVFTPQTTEATDFESGLNGWAVAGVGVTGGIVDSGAHSGNYCLHGLFSAPSVYSSLLVQKTIGDTDVAHGVSAGTVSFWYKCTGAIQITVAETNLSYDFTPINDGQWHQITQAFAAISSVNQNSKLNINFLATGSGPMEVWVDDIVRPL